jgi:hypothetical protein
LTRSRCARFFLLIAAVATLSSLACNHKPAYSDVPPSETEKARERARQPAPADDAAGPAPSSGGDDQQATPAPPAPTPVPPPPPASIPAAPGEPPTVARSTEMKPPPFLDPNTGEFRDLPRYPRAARTYAQIGPIMESKRAVHARNCGVLRTNSRVLIRLSRRMAGRLSARLVIQSTTNGN